MARADGDARAGRLSAKRAPARKAKIPPRTPGVRWWAVAAIAATVLIGLPLAHAFIGELGAVLLGTFIGGFALGRATSR
ncbi:MAG: hypothetical protein JWO24_1245 [Rhodospirillales bacterium]|jgi:hypothetical protein|nr:hypothetical protein [Rhodospirillales bacterium]